jgi:uncharacterized protein YdeI (YjbR/CyaY-like superfamily)
LVYYKKHTGKPRVSYNEAVEEALCFGWIDSTVKRIDDDRYMQKFTPRKKDSGWSELNKKRVEKLTRLNKMEAAGLNAVVIAKENEKWDEVSASRQILELSAEFIEMLNENPEASSFYKKLAPSHKKNYVNWVMSAKKHETRLRRCKEMIRLLADNKKPGMI